MMTLEEKIDALESNDFAAFLAGDIAYIRHVDQDGMSGFGIFAADGTQLTIMADREVAEAAVRQHGMEPVSVH